MAKESFILVNLNEDTTKELAQTLQSATCKSILNLLSKEEATETEIARLLSMPISTVHYNLQLLLKAKLVLAEEYHYSQKGKEVLHYKLANQFIVIAPRQTEGLHETLAKKLKNILPLAIITAGGSVLIFLFTNSLAKSS